MGGRSIEEIIRRAMEEGKFDNLPGKGLPLNLDQDPHVDPEWRAAYQVLKSGGFTLPWIESLQEINTKLQQARMALSSTWIWYMDKSGDLDPSSQRKYEWDRACVNFSQQIAAINKDIRSYNLQVPNDRFQLPLIDAQVEIDRLTSS
jgi:DnaJ family protein C protein 28